MEVGFGGELGGGILGFGLLSFFCFVRIAGEEGGREGGGIKYFGRGLCYVRMGVYGLLTMMMIERRVVVRGLVCLRQSRRVDDGGGLGTCGALM